jgi:SNF family Na+-dependent transporter
VSAEVFPSSCMLQFIALLRKHLTTPTLSILLWVNDLLLGKRSRCRSFRCTQQFDKNWNVSADKLTTISCNVNRTCSVIICIFYDQINPWHLVQFAPLSVLRHMTSPTHQGLLITLHTFINYHHNALRLKIPGNSTLRVGEEKRECLRRGKN